MCDTALENDFCHSVRTEKMTWTVRRVVRMLPAAIRGEETDILGIPIKYVRSSMWLTAADNGAWQARGIQNRLACFNDAAVCSQRCDQSGGGGEILIYPMPFLSESLRRTLDRLAFIRQKFAWFCSSMTHCATLAKGDMPYILFILNNFCESLLWISENANILCMPLSFDLERSCCCQTTTLK